MQEENTALAQGEAADVEPKGAKASKDQEEDQNITSSKEATDDEEAKGEIGV